jgi:polyketide cyclase/dehydrase/lipid transport protein
VRLFSLQPCDEAFFESAPVRDAATFDIPLPAETVWAELTAGDALGWCRALDIDWTSPRPFGVGTTRTARVYKGTALVLRERFFTWEEGRRKSFYGLEASLPAYRRLAEDYLVEPTSDESCRLTWVIASEPTALGRAMAPLTRPITNSFFKDTRRHYGIG